MYVYVFSRYISSNLAIHKDTRDILKVFQREFGMFFDL